MIERSLVNWAVDKIKTHEEVSSTEIIADDIILVKRLNGSEIRVAAFSFSELNMSNVSEIVSLYKFDFLLNIKSEAIFKGEIYSFLDYEKISFGNLSDL